MSVKDKKNKSMFGEREREREREKVCESGCVCVCERERERERDSERGKLFSPFFTTMIYNWALH